MIQIPLTEEQYAQKVQQLVPYGVAITGRAGQIAKDGVTVAYAYDGKTLTLTVKHKPFVLAESYIDGQIKHWFGV